MHVSALTSRCVARQTWVACLFGAALTMAGCGREQTRADPSRPVLRIGVLPDLDSLPMRLAESRGWFTEAGVEVVLLQVSSAVERDQLLQSGRIHGLVTDPVALALYNREDRRVVSVRHSMLPAAGRPQFRLLAAPGSGVDALEQLKAVPVGVSKGTVIEYTCYRTLEAGGLRPGDIETVSVPSIPARMTMLHEGKIKAAVLPEPLASLAVAQGALPLADSVDQSGFVCSILAFTIETCEESGAAVDAFVSVMDRACSEINADPAAYRELAVQSRLLPAPLADSFETMTYPVGTNLDRNVYSQAVGWLKDTLGITVDTPFEATVR